jgi:hypothetical protein
LNLLAVLPSSILPTGSAAHPDDDQPRVARDARDTITSAGLSAA